MSGRALASTPDASTGARPGTIALYLANLSGGGAEMVAVRLVNQFARMGQSVHLVVNEMKGPLVGQVSPDVAVFDLGSSRTIAALPKLRAYLRRENPAALVSVMLFNNVNALLARYGGGWRGRLVVTQHNTFSIQARDSAKNRMFSTLFALGARGSDAMVGVSRGVADDMAAAIRVAPERVRVIYNPIITHDFAEQAAVDPGHPWFGAGGPVLLAVGRLMPQKDYPTLLKALAIVRRSVPARLIIVGDGPLLGELQQAAQALGVSEAVDFAGYKPSALPYMARADALVMTSAFEGFGNVLAEALACGTPAISTATNGPVEILENGRFGPVTPIGDAQGTADAILATLASPPDKEFLRAAAQRFDCETIARQYIDVALGAR